MGDIIRDKTRWARIIAEAGQTRKDARKITAELRAAQRSIKHNIGTPTQGAQEVQTEPQRNKTWFTCLDCNEKLQSQAAMSNYRRIKHGDQRREPYYATSTVCPGCGRTEELDQN